MGVEKVATVRVGDTGPGRPLWVPFDPKVSEVPVERHICEVCGRDFLARADAPIRYLPWCLILDEQGRDVSPQSWEICPDCYPAEVIPCDRCDAYFRAGLGLGVLTPDGERVTVCPECAREAVECRECGQWCFVSPYSGDLCMDCERALEEADDYLAPYGASPSGGWENYAVRRGDGPLLGMELETCGLGGYAVRLAQDAPFETVASEDGSLCHDGAEFAVAPADLAAWQGAKAELRRWLRSLEDEGAEVHQHCGLHIHVSRGWVEARGGVDAVARMCALIHRNESEFTSIAGRSSCYAAFRSYYSPEDWRHYAEVGRRDYWAACPREDTVEVRIFRPSFRGWVVLAYLELCDALARYCVGCEWGDVLAEDAFARFLGWMRERGEQYRHALDLVRIRVREEV